MTKPLLLLNVLFLALSAAGILLVFLVYPLAAWAVGRCRRAHAPGRVARATPTLSLLVVARNAEGLIEDKLRNALSLEYPLEQLDCVFVSDGSTDCGFHRDRTPIPG